MFLIDGLFFNFNTTMEKKNKRKEGEFNFITFFTYIFVAIPFKSRNTILTLAESPSQRSHKKPETLFL